MGQGVLGAPWHGGYIGTAKRAEKDSDSINPLYAVGEHKRKQAPEGVCRSRLIPFATLTLSPPGAML